MAFNCLCTFYAAIQFVRTQNVQHKQRDYLLFLLNCTIIYGTNREVFGEQCVKTFGLFLICTLYDDNVLLISKNVLQNVRKNAFDDRII